MLMDQNASNSTSSNDNNNLCNNCSAIRDDEIPPLCTEVIVVCESDPLLEEIKSCTGEHSASDSNSTHFNHYAFMMKKWKNLRAWVLGAIDGLICVSSILMGVGGADIEGNRLLLAGIAAWIGGALSIACGEFVSAYSMLDMEKADLRAEQFELQHAAEAELNELTLIYVERGLSRKLARQVAEELTANDALRAHARDELGIDIEDDHRANPYSAAFASAVAFMCGGLVPVLAAGIGMHWEDLYMRLTLISASTSFMMLLCGMLAGYYAGAGTWVGGLRVMCGGLVTMGITYGAGRLVLESGL